MQAGRWTAAQWARLWAAAACMTLGGGLALAGDAPAVGKWVSLFNGKDLDGWTPKIKGCELGENFNNTFRVEDGVLKVSYDQYGGDFGSHFGHLFCKGSFTNYILRLEYRFTGEQCKGGAGWAFRNSGVMIHGQPPATMRKDQDFPVSIEVQLLGGNGKDERSTANMCSPGTHIFMKGQLTKQHCVNSKSKTFHGDQWVALEVEAHGSTSIKHKINGETVMEYEQPVYDDGDGDAKPFIKDGDVLIRGGSISLQSESHPVEFRKIEIMLLEK